MSALAALLLCSALTTPSLAQTSTKNRIDLDKIRSLPGSASSPYGQVVIGFYPTDSACPEQHGTVEIKAGVMSLHHLEQARSVKLSKWSDPLKAVSDDEWQYQIATSECRIALNVRLKLRTDTNNWQQALLPDLSRPSITMDQKQAILRDALARAREP